MSRSHVWVRSTTTGLHVYLLHRAHAGALSASAIFMSDGGGTTTRRVAAVAFISARQSCLGQARDKGRAASIIDADTSGGRNAVPGPRPCGRGQAGHVCSPQGVQTRRRPGVWWAYTCGSAVVRVGPVDCKSRLEDVDTLRYNRARCSSAPVRCALGPVDGCLGISASLWAWPEQAQAARVSFRAPFGACQRILDSPLGPFS